MKTNIIYNEDCIGKKGMEILPDKSINMILCDLPYGTTACKWDTIIPFEPLWKEYKRIIKDNGAIVLTASQPFTSKLVVSNIKMFKYCWVWLKSYTTGFMNANKMPLKSFEDVLIFHKTLPVYNPQGIIKIDKRHIRKRDKETTIYNNMGLKDGEYIQEFTNYPKDRIEITGKERTLHPTQKPVALFEYLIKTYTNEEDIVLDNCIGSGTTAIACKRLGRYYIGFETSKKYCDIAKTRLQAEKTLWDK